MLLFCLLSTMFILAGIFWIIIRLSINKYLFHSIWDIFYIIAFLTSLLLWIYYKFFSFEPFALWDIKLFLLLIMLSIIDLRTDTYFKIEEYHDFEEDDFF